MSTILNNALRECIARRRGELGMSERRLLEKAGLTHDWFQATPAHGRRVDTLERLAHALGWTLPQLLTAADASLKDKKTTSRKRMHRNLCVVCGDKLANPLICWSPGNRGIAEFLFHLDCLWTIATALTVREQNRPRSVTNGGAHTPFGINIAVRNGGDR